MQKVRATKFANGLIKHKYQILKSIDPKGYQLMV